MSLDPRDLIFADAIDGALEPLKGYEGAFIRRISIDEADQLAQADGRSGALLIALAVVREDGSALFTSADVEKLAQLKVGPFRAIMNQVTAVNRMDGDAAEDASKN